MMKLKGNKIFTNGPRKKTFIIKRIKIKLNTKIYDKLELNDEIENKYNFYKWASDKN